MKIITTKSFIDFILREYDDSFDGWYANFLPNLRNYKKIKNNKVEVNLDPTIWNDAHEYNALTWFAFIVKSDSNPFGRLMDTYEDESIGDKAKIRAFMKESRNVRAQLKDYKDYEELF